MAKSTIITQLKADHKEVSALFEQISAGRPGRKRQELYAQLDQALSVHADFEEARVYPILEGSKKAKDIALEAVEEHGQIKRLLAELRDLDPQDERWMAKFTVLKEDVRHHVKEEEGDAFPKLKALADEERLIALGEEYQEAKAGAPQVAGGR